MLGFELDAPAPTLRSDSPRRPEGPLFSLHVDAETEFSGGEVQVFQLLEGLRAHGQRVLLVAPPGSCALVEAHRRGLECLPVRLRNDLDLPSVLALRRAILRLQPDIVHLHTGRATWLGGHAAHWAHVPAICTRRMDREVKRCARTRWTYSSLIARVAAISGPVRERLIAGGIDPGRIERIPDGVDPTSLLPCRAPGELRREIGVGDSEFVLLMLAALVRRKGVDVLLEALALLAARGLRPSVWIAGEGKDKTALELLARQHELAHVRFLGWRKDVADLLGACDALVLPSRREGLGVAALEAMAAGRAVIASAVGGLGEAVVDHECGLLVRPEDPKQLASAIETLIRNPTLRERLGSGGRARVTQGYLSTQMVMAYDELYRAVLAEAS
jgi:glycosyltransferase involved in cell wall biosynthesis